MKSDQISGSVKMSGSVKKTILPNGIYGILAEKFSLGRDNVTVAQLMVDGGIDILQYREKRHEKSMKDMYEECLAIRKITARAGVPFIINDFADLALAVHADGVHVGQEDMPVTALKQISGDNMIVGCSTHSPGQAKQAVRDGADYIGVGPVFSTQTKEDVCDPVGFDYLTHVAANTAIPFVAIGGIKKHNLAEVVKNGAECVCLVTEIVGSEDIPGRIQELKKIYSETLNSV